MIFERLKSNVKDRLGRPTIAVRRAGSFQSFDVVIDLNERDAEDAARVRDYLGQRGLFAQFSTPTRPKDNRLKREKKNGEQFYKRALRFVVFYGQTDDEWANDTCFAMSNYLPDEGRGLVVLAPPPDQPRTKRYYRPPDGRFVTKPCPDGKYEAAIDEWLAGR